jgi:hypothetical protein
LFGSFSAATRDDWHRDRDMMKTPVGLVTVALTAAILFAASLLIITGTHGEDREWPARILSPARN